MLETEKGQTEQMQQMFDSEMHKTALKVLAPGTYKSLISTHSEETIDHLKLMKCRNEATTFLPLKPSSGGSAQYIKDR